MKTLLVVSALLELPTGLALSIAPSSVVTVLLGAPLETSASVAVSRVAGRRCSRWAWPAGWHGGTRRAAPRRAAQGLVVAMLLYNVAVMGILVHARMGAGLFSVAFWPVLLVHAGLAGWCIACLPRRRAS